LFILKDKLDTKWESRGNIEFVSKLNSKNNKAFVKITNEIFNKDVFKNVIKECQLNGTYLVRISIGAGFLFSSMRAVNIIKN
jgi:hypothetical protein